MKASLLKKGALALLKKGALALAAVGLSVSALTGCGGGGSGGGGGVIIVDPGYEAWYDVYGSVCGYGAPSPGCNFYANGWKIIDLEDPYFQNDYYLEYNTFYYYDSYGIPSEYTGWAWWSPSNILYDDFGDALNNNDGKGRDFEADVAKAEVNVVKKAAKHLQEKYDLSPTVSMKAARYWNDYAKIGKDRARTEKDLAAMAGLYGVDMGKVKNALTEVQKGETKALENLVDEAATNWGTTPETMKEILKTWYGNQIEQI